MSGTGTPSTDATGGSARNPPRVLRTDGRSSTSKDAGTTGNHSDATAPSNAEATADHDPGSSHTTAPKSFPLSPPSTKWPWARTASRFQKSLPASFGATIPTSLSFRPSSVPVLRSVPSVHSRRRAASRVSTTSTTAPCSDDAVTGAGQEPSTSRACDRSPR